MNTVVTAAADGCPFEDLCREYHPDIKDRRDDCSGDGWFFCARYWAFLDGYHGLDDEW